jgi:ABC-type glycerol-3-phosphate transport system substrate-binding protein
MELQNISRRSFLKLFGYAAGGLVLVSCGGGGDSGSTSTRIIIDSWALAYAPFKEMATKYNELHPEAKISIEAGSSWLTKIVGQIKSDKVQWSGAGVMAPFNDLAAWVQLGLIQPIDNFLTASTEEAASGFLGDMLPPVKDDEVFEGNLYGIPFSLENISYHWNTDWFGKAGVSQAPATWQELYDSCKAVKDYLAAQGKTDTYALGFDLGHLNRNLGTLFFSTIDQPYTQVGMLKWETDEMRESLSFMRKMSRDGLTPPNCGEGLDVVDLWTRGRIASLYSCSSRGLWAQKNLGYDTVITSQVPTLDGTPHSGTAFWGNSIAIINKAPMPQAAIDFLIYACGPQNAAWQKAIITAGTSPVFNSVYDGQLQTDPELAPFKWMTELRDQVAVSVPAPKNYYYQLQNEAWTRHWPEYLKDDSTMTEDELIQAVLQTTAELQKQVIETVPTLVP